MNVVGIDACRGGWVAVVIDTGGFVAATRAATVAEVLTLVGPVSHVGIDIPIGGSTTGVRRADQEARRVLGPRRASVFDAPHPDVLAAASYADANAASRRLTGRGLSAQAWHLVPRIREVAALVGAPTAAPIVEIHPEVSFREMAGAPLPHPKSTWAGIRHRSALLAGVGIELPDDLGPAGRAGVDDVVDAAAVAWSARRMAGGAARSLPDPPETDADGLPMAIWV
ncbi:MAG TPA: DUF429 domain-containing protein [Acidimicrobiales bacterium]|nr:DUF429 domain-containing protein [Acidimicrobiales bacterium]